MLIRPALREYRTWTTDSRRWAPYHPRPDDIIISAFPKSGQTWTQQIVSSLVFWGTAFLAACGAFGDDAPIKGGRLKVDLPPATTMQ